MYGYYVSLVLLFIWIVYFIIRYSSGGVMGTSELILALISAAAVIAAAIINNHVAISKAEKAISDAINHGINNGSKEHEHLLFDHQTLLEQDKQILDYSKTVDKYVSKQEVLSQQASEKNVQLDQILASIQNLATELANASNEVARLEKAQEQSAQTITELQRENFALKEQIKDLDMSIIQLQRSEDAIRRGGERYDEFER